jgi:hypothetical protein
MTAMILMPNAEEHAAFDGSRSRNCWGARSWWRERHQLPVAIEPKEQERVAVKVELRNRGTVVWTNIGSA